MLSHVPAPRSFVVPAAVLVLLAACTSTSSPPNAASDAGLTDAAPATCDVPGAPGSGPADSHCTTAQATDPSICTVDDAGPDAGDSAGDCDYGATMPNQEGDDDDCKYHVKWTSSPICEGAGGVTFTVTATHKTDNSPVTDLPKGILIEVFQPVSATAACDDKSNHAGPNTGAYLTQSARDAGVYSGPVVFDAAGLWTVRFHLHEECADVLPTSPHGHAAFHINVP